MATKVRESLLGPPKRPDSKHVDPGAAKRKSRAPAHTAAGGRPSSMQAARPSTAAASLAPGSRRTSRSSVYGAAGPPPIKKDPRPLSDKSYQQAEIKRLCAYLAEKGYPQELKPRALQSPSTKDFVYILNFLLSQIDESLMINGFKLDEEVPMVLKFLGYPFNVSKHHLLSVGSPHSWPIVLGVLMWLVDGTIEDNSTQLMFPKDFESDDGVTHDEEKFLMETSLYQYFLQFGIESEQYRAAVQTILDSYDQLYQEALAQLNKETETVAQLEQEVEKLSCSSIDSLQTKLKGLYERKNEFSNYITNQLLPLISKAEELCQDKEASICHTEMQIAATQEKTRELEEQVRQQPMSSMEARKLKQRVKDDRETVAKLRAMVEECNQRVSELQMQHNQSVFAIDKKCREVNDKLRKLATIVPDAASLPTMDYDTSKRADPVVLNQLVAQTKTIKQGLQEINQQVATILSDTETQVINAESVKSMLQNNITTKQLEIEKAEHAVEIEMTSLQQQKKKDEEQQKATLVERHMLEKQLMSLQEQLQDDSVRRRNAAILKQYEKERLEMAETTRQITEEIQQYGLAFAEYLEACQMKRESVSKQVDRLVEEFQSIKCQGQVPKKL